MKQKRAHWGVRTVLKKCVQAICCTLVLFVVGYLFFWCLDPAHFPILSVKVVGQRNHITEEEIQQIVVGQIKGGFFRLKVSTLQQQLLSLPWTKQVDIRKVWPDKLVIHLEEHSPAALWRSKGTYSGIFSDTGAVFYPSSPVGLKDLPVLEGPEGNANLVWQQYVVMEEILASLNVKITQCVLAPRGAWHLRLSNDITIMLGTSDIVARLRRFTVAYENQLSERQHAMAYVDLRYTRGMAIGWKPGLNIGS